MEEQKKGSLVKGISAELQDEVLAILIFNPEIYNATQQIMSEYFFYGDSYKILYKALKQFHEDTDANPTLKDMMIQVALLTQTHLPLEAILYFQLHPFEVDIFLILFSLYKIV